MKLLQWQSIGVHDFSIVKIRIDGAINHCFGNKSQTYPSPCLGPVDLQPIISLCQHAYRLSKTLLIHRLKLCIFHVMQLLSENFCTKTEQHVYNYLLFSGSILRKIFSQIWYELMAYMATHSLVMTQIGLLPNLLYLCLIQVRDLSDSS